MSEYAGERCEPREPERALELFGRGVRTALRNNATAYGFSISITTAYGLASGASGPSSAIEPISFAIAAALAFVLAGAAFVVAAPQGSLSESGQVATISGAVDHLAVVAAVAAAFGLSRITGTDIAAWARVPLSSILELAGPARETKHVVFYAMDDKGLTEGEGRYGFFYDTIPLHLATNRQTILALDRSNTAPRSCCGSRPISLGFKMVKWIVAIEVRRRHRRRPGRLPRGPAVLRRRRRSLTAHHLLHRRPFEMTGPTP